MKTTRITPKFLLALGLAVMPQAPAASDTATQTVRPGSVVRWPGEGIESCHLDERQWKPIDGACWYPVDLLANGSIQIERRRMGGRESRALQVADYPYDVQHLTIEDESRVHLSADDLARVERESARIRPLWSLGGAPDFALPLGPPLAALPEGGRFGARRVINGEPRSPHTGADYAAATGTPVLAVAAGRVALAEEHFFAGNSVFLDHGDGLISMYFHLSDIAVEPGQRVERGDPLGRVGATGRATGPHLHFGLRWHGARVDPALLMQPPDALPAIE